MFKNLLLTFFLFFSSFVTIYPSKKENTNLIDYCYSFEKILARNSLEKSRNVSKKFKTFTEDITLFSTNKTRGELAKEIIDRYKTSKKSNLMSFLPNQFYCLAGYWIEKVKPGTFQSIFYEKSKQRINQYKNSKREIDQFIKDINAEYKYIKKEINDFF